MFCFDQKSLIKWIYSNDNLLEMIASSKISFDQTIRVAIRSRFSDVVRISKISQVNHYVK